jgi:hypothetical protein
LKETEYVYWPQPSYDGEYHSKTMSSSIRTTALVLLAYANIQPDNALVPGIVDYLADQRQGIYGWGTTNETSFTILALTGHLIHKESKIGSTPYEVLVNGKNLAFGTLEVSNTSASIEIPLAELNNGVNALTVTTQGDSPIYFDLSTRYDMLRSEVKDFDLVGMLRARAGANWVWNSANYRTQDNTFQGSRDIRGFESYGFGPRDPVTGDALGGLYYWNSTAELSFPMPYLPESMGIRGAFFADAGQLWGLDSASRAAILASNPGVSTAQLDDNTLRASVGASVIWASPFGPLRFDYAYPISQAPWDSTREFSFGVSTSF